MDIKTRELIQKNSEIKLDLCVLPHQIYGMNSGRQVQLTQSLFPQISYGKSISKTEFDKDIENLYLNYKTPNMDSNNTQYQRSDIIKLVGNQVNLVEVDEKRKKKNVPFLNPYFFRDVRCNETFEFFDFKDHDAVAAHYREAVELRIRFAEIIFSFFGFLLKDKDVPKCNKELKMYDVFHNLEGYLTKALDEALRPSLPSLSETKARDGISQRIINDQKLIDSYKQLVELRKKFDNNIFHEDLRFVYKLWFTQIVAEADWFLRYFLDRLEKRHKIKITLNLKVLRDVDEKLAPKSVKYTYMKGLKQLSDDPKISEILKDHDDKRLDYKLLDFELGIRKEEDEIYYWQ